MRKPELGRNRRRKGSEAMRHITDAVYTGKAGIFPEELFSDRSKKEGGDVYSVPGEDRERRCLELISRLARGEQLTEEEFSEILSVRTWKTAGLVFRTARRIREKYYGKRVFIRGLIEFTNYCRNDCYYCGIRRSNQEVSRYRLTPDEILSCCEEGRRLGFRTFVLQGGEDLNFEGREGLRGDRALAKVVEEIKRRFPDCAVTLSVGERDREVYEQWFQAGADRYLLRHETANTSHYHMLHPENMHLSNRKQCLYDLKELGYQVGAGFMVGSPGQTWEHLAEDLVFLQELQPQMVGIGPFIPHHDTKFAKEEAGSVDLTLKLLSVLRLLLPKVLLPATTALGTLDPLGREKGLSAGANVVMPNLSPVENRKQYELYDNKICTGDEAAKCKNCLSARVRSAGYELVEDRGDYIG